MRFKVSAHFFAASPRPSSQFRSFHSLKISEFSHLEGSPDSEFVSGIDLTNWHPFVVSCRADKRLDGGEFHIISS